LVALLLRFHDQRSSGAAVACLFVAQLGPVIVLAPAAGLLLDRVETTRLLAATSAVQAIAATALAMVTRLELTLVLVVVLGVGKAISDPGLLALVPAAAGEQKADRAYGNVQAAQAVARALAPACAGLLVAQGGAGAALAVDGVTFGAVALACLLLKTRRRPTQVPDARRAHLADGFRIIKGNTLVLAATVIVSLVFLAGVLVNVASVFFVRDVLQVGPVGFGVLEGAWPTAAAIAGRAVGSRRIVGLQPRLIAVGALGIGVGLAAPALFPRLGVTLAGFVVAGAGNSVIVVALRSLVRAQISAGQRGQAFAIVGAGVNLATVSGTVIGGASIEAVGARGAFLAAGIGALAVGAAAVALAVVPSEVVPGGRRIPTRGPASK
jgi:MFS family permease